MASIFPADGRPFRVLPAQSGNILAYGNTSDVNPSGCWTFQFVANELSDAEFAVMGRSNRISTADTTVPWLPVPYRRVTINNVASDYALVSAVIAPGATLIQVPANGMSIGLMPSITTGETLVLAQHAEGATAP